MVEYIANENNCSYNIKKMENDLICPVSGNLIHSEGGEVYEIQETPDEQS